MTSDAIPTIYDWGGGRPAFERWFNVFYDLVERDDLLVPLFGSPVGTSGLGWSPTKEQGLPRRRPDGRIGSREPMRRWIPAMPCFLGKSRVRSLAPGALMHRIS